MTEIIRKVETYFVERKCEQCDQGKMRYHHEYGVEEYVHTCDNCKTKQCFSEQYPALVYTWEDDVSKNNMRRLPDIWLSKR